MAGILRDMCDDIVSGGGFISRDPCTNLCCMPFGSAALNGHASGPRVPQDTLLSGMGSVFGCNARGGFCHGLAFFGGRRKTSFTLVELSYRSQGH